MQQKVISFPAVIEAAITQLLAEEPTEEWLSRTETLHHRYVHRERNKQHRYISDRTDALAYLALRSPATYAQIYGSMAALAEMIPSWRPQTLLDLGSGPGVGLWAAKSVWLELEAAVCMDQERNFLELGETISQSAHLEVNVHWKQGDFVRDCFTHSTSSWLRNDVELFDLVVVSNVLNELSPAQADMVLGQAWNLCAGVLLVIEAGTPFGSGIVASAARKLAKAGSLIAPYVDNSLVMDKSYYLHFPQRFIRPEFERRVRQRMREGSLVASDWEEAKYSYVAIGRMEAEKQISGRCVGPVRIQKGFLEVPVLTRERVAMARVMKREKEKYAEFKKLQWGELVNIDGLLFIGDE